MSEKLILRAQAVISGGLALSGEIYVPDFIGGDPYLGKYVVNPDFAGVRLETKNKILSQDVLVNPIEVSRVSNTSDGITVFIGGITNG